VKEIGARLKAGVPCGGAEDRGPWLLQTGALGRVRKELSLGL
jgi:hypothetical protein